MILSDDRFVPGGLGGPGSNTGMYVLRDSFLWLKGASFLWCQSPRIRNGKPHGKEGRGWEEEMLGLGRHI